MTDVSDKVGRALARFDRVTRALDERQGSVREAARRERKRVNADLGRRAARVGVAIGIISILTIIVGLVTPIGMFGFLAAVSLAIGVAALMAFMPSRPAATRPPTADLPNGEMVQRFDSYLYRTRAALPAPARAEIDAMSAQLGPLKETLERIDTVDPEAQDARRLMSLHLPGLIDRYLNVPAGFRAERDGEGVTVDERLVEGLAAGRVALREI
ncbi:MAG TPA: hypothetical protein VD768_07460, partial [Sphingomicrobium sp.]|nr:hypothetical protein [Sphingomicrobium sp.]